MSHESDSVGELKERCANHCQCRRLSRKSVLAKNPILIVPSQWTKDLAINKFGFERVETWPVGIPLPEIKRDDDVHQFDCMIYSKRRSVQEVNAVVDLLQIKKISFRTLVYGNYNQEELALMCSRAKFCFLLNGTESQGIAEAAIQRAKGLTGDLIKGLRRLSSAEEDSK